MGLNDSHLLGHLDDHSNNQYKHDTDAELGDKITLLAGQINVGTYHFLKMLAEFDARKGWMSGYKKQGHTASSDQPQGCIRSCSQWLSLRCG